MYFCVGLWYTEKNTVGKIDVLVCSHLFPAEALANGKSDAVFHLENGIVVSSDHWYVARPAACF